jgi:hypothetical protein
MKKLPLNAQSNINGYLFYAYPYSILNTFPEYDDYLMEHYLQCFGYIAEGINNMAFGYADGVSYNDMFYDSGPLDIFVHSYTVGLQLDIKEYIVSSIDNDNYVVIFVDEYYIESRPSYQKDHRLHDILIFGYDDDKFDCLTFNQGFLFSSFTQNQIYDAYKFGASMDITMLSEWINDKSIILIKKKPIKEQYSFSTKRFIENLKLYADGKFNASYNSFVIPEEKCHVGVYDTNIIKYCLGNPDIYILYPAIHAWCESKKNLLVKLKYCYGKMKCKNNELILDYEKKVERQAEKIRLSFIKHQISGKLNKDNIIFILENIFYWEFNIINNMHDEIMATYSNESLITCELKVRERRGGKKRKPKKTYSKI